MPLAYLDGIKVLDLSQFLPGPFATQMLADMGADVVKIEPPKGDPMRELDPVTNARGPSPFHALVNAGKRVVVLDLKSDAGRRDFEALVAGADVLMESYRPGVMARLGFAPEKLREINPMLVHCALSGYGQNGPMRLAGGHDINYVAAAGVLGLTGPADAPTMGHPPVADYAAALQSVVAILGALIGRGRSGKGAYLDVAMADCVLAWQSQALTALSRASGGEGVPARGANLLTGGAACYRVYRTKDGRFVSLGAIEEVFWRNFCEAAGRSEWVARQLEPMPQNGLIKDVAAFFAAHDRAHWDNHFAAVDCCYHPVLDVDEIAAHPQNMARALIVPDAALGGTSVLLPFWSEGHPPENRTPLREADAADVIAGWRDQ